MKKLSLVSILNSFILLTAISFLFDDVLSFGVFSLFMILFIYLANKSDQNIKEILYINWIKRSAIVYFSFLILQLIPLPSFLVKYISGTSYKLLMSVSDSIPSFHPISIVPFETFFLAIEIFILLLFGYSIFRIKIKKKDIISILDIIAFSIIFKVFFSCISFLFDKDHNGFQNYLIYNKELRFSILLLFPLILGLIFFRIEFLRKSTNFSERFKILYSSVWYWYVYIFGFVIALLILLIWGSKWDKFISSFCIVVFFSLIFYLKQNKRKRKSLKPIILISLIIFFIIGFVEINRSPDNIGNIHNTLNYKSLTHFSLTGIGFGTSRFIAPSILRYTWIENNKKMINSNLLFYEVGILGLLSIGIFLFFIVLSLIKMWRIRKHPDVKILVLGLFCTLGCVLISGFTDSIYQLRYYRFAGILLLAITFKLLFYKRDSFL